MSDNKRTDGESLKILMYGHVSLNDGDTFWEMRR